MNDTILVPTKVVQAFDGDACALFAFLQFAHKTYFPVSVPRVAKMLPMGQRRVRRAIHALRDAGYLDYNYNGRWVEFCVKMPHGSRWLYRDSNPFSKIAFRTESHVRVPQDLMDALLAQRITPDAFRLRLLMQAQPATQLWTWDRFCKELQWSRAKLGRMFRQLRECAGLITQYGIRTLNRTIPKPFTERQRWFSQHAHQPYKNLTSQREPEPEPSPHAELLTPSKIRTLLQQLRYLLHSRFDYNVATRILERGLGEKAIELLKQGLKESEVRAALQL